MNSESDQQITLTPTPTDPSKLTTDAVNAATDISRRELGQLKELVFERIEGRMETVSQRFATVNEKLNSHDNEFSFVEDRRVEQKLDTEKAVQNALAAAKEAVSEQTQAGKEAIGKSETTTSEAIKALAELVKSGQDQQRRDTDELKARVGLLEGSKKGGDAATALFITVAVAIMLAAGLVVSLIP